MTDTIDLLTDRTPAMPPRLCEYAAEVTAERLDKMLDHVDGVRQAEDPEAVHQMRVWSRRSRAALEIFDVCFQGRAFTELEKEVKAATDALSEARDLDVMIINLEARALKLRPSRRGGIASFVESLRQQREARQESVAGAITNLESHDLARRFRALATRASKPAVCDNSAADRKGKSRRNGKRARRDG